MILSVYDFSEIYTLCELSVKYKLYINSLRRRQTLLQQSLPLAINFSAVCMSLQLVLTERETCSNGHSATFI